MNTKHLFAMSIAAAGLIWSGGSATASDFGKERAPDGSMSSGSANSGDFSGAPDQNSPGGPKEAGTSSEGNMEMGKVRQGGEPDKGLSEPSGSSTGNSAEAAGSSNSSSGGDYSGSSTDRPGFDEMNPAQVGQSTDEQVGDKPVNTGMKDGESQTTKGITGEVLRIEGDHYFVKGQDGKEVRLHIDQTTKMSEARPDQGELIEATVNEQNHVLSIHSPDRRNDHILESGDAVEPR